MGRWIFACVLIVVLTGCRHTTSSSPASATDGRIPLTSNSEQARALYTEARARNEILQAHDAHDLFARAAAVDPTFAMAEYGLAATAPDARSQLEHLRLAIALSSRASDGERLMILALQARINADPARSRQYAESLVVLYRRDERAHWTLGNAYLAQQRFNDAVGEYQRAIDLNPKFSLAFNSLGYAHRAAGNDAAAERAFLSYIALVPNDPNPYDSYAELLMKTGRFDASIAQYRKALAIDPHFGGSFVGIAANHMYAGRYDAAVDEARAYAAAARNDGERRTALMTEALVYIDAGQPEKTVRALERSLDIARAAGDTISMSADIIAEGDAQLAAGHVHEAHRRYGDARELVQRSALPAAIKEDFALADRYRAAHVALAQHDLVMATTLAASYLKGAESRHNDLRVREAHALNGLIALAESEFDRSLAELALADRQDPVVLHAMGAAYAGKGDTANASSYATQSARMYTLPTLPSVLLRAKLNQGAHQ